MGMTNHESKKSGREIEFKIQVLAWNPKNVKQFLTENGKWSQEKFPEAWKKVPQNLCVSYMWCLLSEGSLCLHTCRDRVPKDLAINHTTCHFPSFWGFSRLGHIMAPGSAWEMLASDIYEFCLHAVRCFSEKCESLSHTATRKLGRTHYYLLHHNNRK